MREARGERRKEDHTVPFEGAPPAARAVKVCTCGPLRQENVEKQSDGILDFALPQGPPQIT